MFFKDLQHGHTVYVYHQNEVKVTTPKVISVSAPHMDITNPQRYNGMVVDLVVECGGNQKTYTLNETAEIAYANDMIISTEKHHIIREIEAAKEQSEHFLSQIEKHKERLQKTTDLLAEFNPVFKEKKETEERFVKIENSVSDIKGMMTEILHELKGK